VSIVALLLSVVSATAEPVPDKVFPPPLTARFGAGQLHYLESCGGCHGIDGMSSPQHVPALRGSVGQFLCTAAGREYLVRLPNVAFADVNDQVLADVMNFVVFGLGGASTPVGTKPYSSGEVATLRRRPLKNRPLADMRARILADAIIRCGTGGS
jgi:hypothetical protein